MRKGEFEIVDDWFTMGLKGTGSKTVVVNDVFIPDERALAAPPSTAPGRPLADLRGPAETDVAPPFGAGDGNPAARTKVGASVSPNAAAHRRAATASSVW